MASTGLNGPYSLTALGVDAAVDKTSAGAYALGYTDSDDVFHVQYVGRSDDDVNARLKTHLPDPYKKFKFGYYQSAVAAYSKECHLYHDFNPPGNKVHPAAPAGSNAVCPICGE